MSLNSDEKNTKALQTQLDFDSKGRLNLGKQLDHEYLTSREIDIIKCLLQGFSAKEAGLKLGISYRTVESYISILKLKLRCNKKSQLIGFCVKLGLFKLLN